MLVELVIPPGASTGWHTHPGGGVFVVDQGVVASYGLDGPLCGPTAIKAGRSLFVSPHAGHPHLVRNESAEPAQLRAFYFNVPKGRPSAAKVARPAECPTGPN